MSIFRRRNKADEVPEGTSAVPQVSGPSDSDDAASAIRARGSAHGPWDISEVSDIGERVDLGALAVPGRPGLELRLEVDQSAQQVTGVMLVSKDEATHDVIESSVQAQLFAAPRSEGLWDEIRTEIGDNLRGAGATVEERDGPFGPELLTRMPMAGPDGRTVFAPVTFVGVDGPRWFLRGVFAGKAAIDPAARASLEELFSDIVVRRGENPMAPREALTLTLPGDPATQGVEADPADENTELNPFERGPEITEVR